MTTPALRGHSRVWMMDGGAGPTVTPEYMANAAAQGLDKSFGEITRIEVPSQTQRGEYDTVGEIQAGEENVTLSLMMRYLLPASRILKVANKRCVVDFQVHIGNCTSPTDYNHGWETGKVLAFERGRLTTYSTNELGSLQSADENMIDEESELSALRFYEIGPMTFAERAKSEIAQEIIKVLVCDSPACGDCENPTDGCQKIYAVSAPAGSSPGLQPEVIVSDDGFSTVQAESTITTLAIGEDPDDAACVGDNLVVISQDSLSLHYAPLDNLQVGTATWTEVSTGFVATKGPRAIDAYSAFDVYIGGAGGYIYFTDDPTSGVTVVDAGVATTQDINDIYAYSADIIIAVGNSNAVVYTTNAGETFQSVTGPAVGIALNAVYARTDREWWVGTADGKLWYTQNQGTTWTQKGFPGSGSGSIEDIVFASNHVGFVSHTLNDVGRILRTISGGHSWYVLPDGSSTLPTQDRLNSLAVCEKDANTLYAAGLAANAADGVLLKGTTIYA